MSRTRYARILLSSVSFSVLAIVFSLLTTAMPANAANRPFPKYDISYQWIHGTPDPNYDPNAPVGDGCLRDPNAEVTHLSFFAFQASINPCDGVRTTIRFYLELKEGEEPTNEFRFGATWHYKDIANPDVRAYVWKPIENFKFDGKPVSKDVLDTDSMEQVVVHKDGQPVRMNNGRGYYQPRHVIYLDQFGTPGKVEEHTFQFDMYLPINADWGGLSWGTGSTGDTQGGTIGATANGLVVKFQSGADFRYVKDSDYRQFLNVADTNLPARRDAGWDGEVPGSTFTIEQCLEDRQLRPLVNSATAADSYYAPGNGPANIPAPWEYEAIEHTTPVNFWGPSGSNLLAAYPYEFLVGAVGEFDSLKGIRAMNLDPNGGRMNLHPAPNNFPYKPTLHGLAKDIAGYRYVDNDLPVVERGLLDVPNTRSGKYPWMAGKNVQLGYNRSGDRLKHYYFTYEQLKGTFKLEKFDGKNPDKKLPNATFALFKKEAYKAFSCALPTDPKAEDYQTVNVCSANGAAAEPGCEATSVRAIAVPGGNPDGTFTTGPDGTFVPAEAQWLEPGEYFVQEVKAPEGYEVKNAFTAFTVSPNTAEVANVRVANEEPPTPPVTPPAPPTPPKPPVTPPAPPAPPKPKLPNTGANVLWVSSLAALTALGGVVLTGLRKVADK